MVRLTQFLLSSLAFLVLAAPSLAAQITLQYSGDSSAATGCDHLRIDYCYGAACNPTLFAARVPSSTPDADGDCSAAAQQLSFPLVIQEEKVPGTICFKVRVVGTNRNITDGVTFCTSVTKAE